MFPLGDGDNNGGIREGIIGGRNGTGRSWGAFFSCVLSGSGMIRFLPTIVLRVGGWLDIFCRSGRGIAKTTPRTYGFCNTGVTVVGRIVGGRGGGAEGGSKSGGGGGDKKGGGTCDGPCGGSRG